MRCLTKLFMVFLLAAFALPESADAQLLKRLKDRAKERVKEKVEDKAEKTVDDAVDKAVDSTAEGIEDAALSAFERKTQPKELNLGENADGPADAPHVRYRSTTSIDLGAFGRMARLMGSDLEHQTEFVAISGDRQRTDTEGASTIMDLENNRLITLDHEKKQYSVLTFDEMADRMDEAVAAMNEQAEGLAESDMEQHDVETDVSFDVSVDRTGRTETINGSPSEQLLVKMRMDFDVQGTDDSGETAQMRGTTYALIDTWVTRDVAGIETIQQFQRRTGQEMSASFMSSDAGASLAALGVDPKVESLMEEAGRELQELDGLPVRSTMHMIIVPEGQELDVAAALDPPAEAKEDRMAAMAQTMAATQGGGEGEAGPAQQVTLMRTVTQISDLEISPLPEDYFNIPADYKEVNLFQSTGR